MVLLALLIMIKIILFINTTNIENNAFIIFIFSTLVSLSILGLLEFLGERGKDYYSYFFIPFLVW
ncbi:MAG: hypothetical protein GXY88_06375 [Tissierellia bacterium]|nr:hypothetical protein [Tissierellia bacterium]